MLKMMLKLLFNSRIKLENGEIEAKGEGFYLKNKIFITYEELKKWHYKSLISEKTSIGVQMGNSGVATG
jgi:hypothetical protein